MDHVSQLEAYTTPPNAILRSPSFQTHSINIWNLLDSGAEEKYENHILQKRRITIGKITSPSCSGDPRTLGVHSEKTVLSCSKNQEPISRSEGQFHHMRPRRQNPCRRPSCGHVWGTFGEAGRRSKHEIANLHFLHGVEQRDRKCR